MLLMTNRRTIYINIAFFAVLIVVYLVINFGSSSPAQQTISFESAGLDRALTPISPAGKPRSIKDYRGAPLLLHFWASWCEPCTHDEKPLRDLFAVAGQSTQFVAVASEDKVEAIRRAGKLDAYPGDVFVEKTGDLALALSVKSYPQTILIDRDGHVVFREEGPLTAEDVRRLKEYLQSTAAAVLPPFSYADADGKKVSSRTLADKVWVADFIFTSCGDTCPLISEKFRALQDKYGHDPHFRLVSFSVDPANDTPERLLAFGRQHGADRADWSFLHPAAGELKSLMVKGFHLGTDENPLVHTAKIVVINRGNVIETYVDGDATDAVTKLEAVIDPLLVKAGNDGSHG